MSRELLQQALDALESLQDGCTDSDDGTVEAITVWCPELIDALRAALAAPQPEPVAWMDDFGNTFPIGANKGSGHWLDDHKRTWVPLYATPQAIDGFGGNLDSAFARAPAVPAVPAVQPLTDEQMDEIWDGTFDSADPKRQLSFRQIITRAIEQAHGIGTQGGGK